jgi:Tol biopolymer transport system component
MRPRLAPVMFLASLVAFAVGAAPAHATFPGANGKIVFTVSLGDSYTQFDVMNADGTGVAPLTAPCCTETSPAWSPDGTKIAFTTDRFARNTGRDIAVMNADGTGLTQLATNASDPAWSPDGTKIAFYGYVARPFNPPNIYAINADGTGLTRLTNTESPVFDGSPAWSPDGTKIAFTRTIPIPPPPGYPGEQNIWVMNADGTDVTRLTSVPYGSGITTEPNWSPDGTKITFGIGWSGGDVAVMNADGSGVTKLYSSPTPTGGQSSQPVWSPDGSKIAFKAQLQGYWYISTMNPDGSGQTLLGGPRYVTDFDWQPLPTSAFKNRAKECKAEGKRGRDFGKCVSAR